MPKLRKNRRIESRWGAEYYTAVRNAVFVTQAQPYVPPAPPPSVKQCAPECETLYMCAQCKDCFHFRSSLDDHMARKSWILGYWCQHCFVTNCKHNPTNDLLCSVCIETDREKRLYLQSRGLRKSQKFGAVRLFYNQCQFFAHVKTHKVNMVHMGDLMLMPLPTNVSEWKPEIDLTCEALMEHTFIIKAHIMDWLREKKISDNWWKLTTSLTKDSRNSVTPIFRRYRGQFYFKPLEIPLNEQFSILNCPYSTSKIANPNSSHVEIPDNVESVDKRTNSSSADTLAPISDESVIENEDTPCTVNDIAFVDCGLASKYFEPEIPVSNARKRSSDVSVKSMQNSTNPVASKFKKNRAGLNCISPNMVMSYGNIIITPKRDMKESPKCPSGKQSSKSVATKSTKSTTPVKVVKSNTAKVNVDKKLNNALTMETSLKMQSETVSASKMDACAKFNQNVHTLTVNSGQKVVTIQSPKHVDISTIIKQLPPHITNNKKIVFIRQATDNVTLPDGKEVHSKTVVHVLPDENEKLLEMKKNVLNEKLPQSSKGTKKGVAKNQSESSKGKGKPFTSKVVYQNGRKYIIKQSSGSKCSRSASNAMIKDLQQGNLQAKSTNGVPPLIPLNSTDIENLSNQERMNSFHGDVSPLTPSPSPSELSSSSSCDVQSRQSSSSAKNSQKADLCCLTTENNDAGIDVQTTSNNSAETLSFQKGEDQNLYLSVKFLNQKPIYTIVDTTAMITKCKEEMLNEFFHLSNSELKKRYNHLQQISEEISRVMNFVTDSVVRENLKAVSILQTVLKHCINKCSGEKSEGSNEVDETLNDWESGYRCSNERSVCKACKKTTKPKHYIPGFSKPAKDDVYCSCYRHVCHKCYTYQGNSTRFVAHQTFHDKEKPYLCPDCYRRFTTYKSLEVHTWTTCFHTLKKRVLGCKVCEVDGFQDMESVARHFAIMHSHTKIACDKCHIILPSYSEYRKHHREKHPDASDPQPIRLVLCKLGRCIVRCEDYMLHMEKHSVVQRLIWFKCPFCAFIHVEAKRIMSHVQSGHDTRLKELISSEVLLNISQVEAAASLLKANPMMQQNKFTNAYTKFCENGTVMPKITNTRTITSEVFERGAHGADDYLIDPGSPQRPKHGNVKSLSPLKSARLSPKILDVRSLADLTSPSKRGANGITSTFIKTEEESDEVEEKKMIKRIEDSDVETEEMKVSVAEMESINAGDSAWNDQADKSMQQDREKKNASDDASTPTKEKEEAIVDGSSGGNVTKQDEGTQQGSISEPPPLIRIPPHVFDSNRSKKAKQATKEGKTVAGARDQKAKTILPQRLALNGPENVEEVLNFSCHLCGQLIDTRSSILNDHFRSKHSQDCKLSSVTTNLLRISTEFINGGYKELLNSRKRKLDYSLSSSKRRRRWTPKKYSDGKNANFAGVGLCVQQETAKDSEGNFRCKKCDKRCSDMVDLREHIASNHRIRGRYLVCLECGDNFVVAPSLQMHLKAFHGIENPITYMAQNTSYAPDNVDDLEAGGKTIEANQCHVCMAVFEDKAAVDKHLRVHGMAFLNRKRIEAQNALKSPEKKSEEEEEKQSPIKTSRKEAVRKDKPAETILDKITATI